MEAEEQGLLGLSSCWELARWREQFSASWAQRNGQVNGLTGSGWDRDFGSPQR